MNRDFTPELTFTASRSSGPGGQNVNKVSTKVELRFNVLQSELLTPEEKEVLFDKLSAKINAEGELVLFSQAERTQLKNREKVTEKFYRLITTALQPVKKRIPTHPSAGSEEKRLLGKRKTSEKKERRKKPE